MRIRNLVLAFGTMLCASLLAQPSSTSDDKFSTKEDTLWIRNGERRLYGVLSRPQHTTGKMPVAIIAHGFNGTHEFGRNYFEPLNKLGYQVYTFDFACGSVNSRSDNNTMNMSILDEQSDLDVFGRIGKYKRPVLIIQGDKDPIVSMKDSERAAKIYKDARLHVISGAGHGFKPKEFEESLQQITLFLLEE